MDEQKDNDDVTHIVAYVVQELCAKERNFSEVYSCLATIVTAVMSIGNTPHEQVKFLCDRIAARYPECLEELKKIKIEE